MRISSSAPERGLESSPSVQHEQDHQETQLCVGDIAQAGKEIPMREMMRQQSQGICKMLSGVLGSD